MESLERTVRSGAGGGAFLPPAPSRLARVWLQPLYLRRCLGCRGCHRGRSLRTPTHLHQKHRTHDCPHFCDRIIEDSCCISTTLMEARAIFCSRSQGKKCAQSGCRESVRQPGRSRARSETLTHARSLQSSAIAGEHRCSPRAPRSLRTPTSRSKRPSPFLIFVRKGERVDRLEWKGEHTAHPKQCRACRDPAGSPRTNAIGAGAKTTWKSTSMSSSQEMWLQQSQPKLTPPHRIRSSHSTICSCAACAEWNRRTVGGTCSRHPSPFTNRCTSLQRSAYVRSPDAGCTSRKQGWSSDWQHARNRSSAARRIANAWVTRTTCPSWP